MDPIAEIKKLYYEATKGTIQKDLERAIDLLKTLPTEDDREKVAVYMDGLSQMRSEWKQAAGGGVSLNAASRPAVSSQRRGAPPARSDRSKASSRRTR